MSYPVIVLFLLKGYSDKYFRNWFGNREVEDSLHKLDRLTQEEARMASAEYLKMAHRIDGKVMSADGIMMVDERVANVGERVRDIEEQAEGVRSDLRKAARASSL